MKSSNYLNCFFRVFVIPKRNLTEPFNFQLDGVSVANSLMPIYQHTIDETGAIAKLGQTALITFDRLFNIRSGLNLKVTEQLSEYLKKNIQSSAQFTNLLFSQKSTCIQLRDLLETPDFNFLDEQFSISPMEENAYFLYQPIFVLTSEQNINSVNFILNQLRGQFLTQQSLDNIRINSLSQKIIVQTNESQLFTGIVQTENDVVKFSSSLRTEIKKLSQIKT